MTLKTELTDDQFLHADHSIETGFAEAAIVIKGDGTPIPELGFVTPEGEYKYLHYVSAGDLKRMAKFLKRLAKRYDALSRE